MSHQPHDAEIRECTECGQQYDLAAQSYYGPRCPSCTDDERTWPACSVCSERVPPVERAKMAVTNRTTGRTEYVPVHKGCK